MIILGSAMIGAALFGAALGLIFDAPWIGVVLGAFIGAVFGIVAR